MRESVTPQPQPLAAQSGQAELDDPRFQRLFENSPVPCHELDARGLIRRVNKKWCALLGYDSSEVSGKPIWEFLAPEARQRAQGGFAEKLDGERSLVPFEREYVRADGSSIIVEVHDELLTSPAGNVEGIRSVLIDVTEQSLAAAELRRLNTWLNSAVQALPDGIITTDVVGVVVSMNAAAERITGWTEYDAVGREIESILGFDGDTGTAAHQLAEILNSQSWSLCFGFGGTEGPRFAQVAFSTMTDPLGSVIGTIARIQELPPHTPPSTGKM